MNVTSRCWRLSKSVVLKHYVTVRQFSYKNRLHPRSISTSSSYNCIDHAFVRQTENRKLTSSTLLPLEQEATLYVHWPFCKQICTFCNFNKYVSNNVDHQRMRKCLVVEAQTLLMLSGVKRISSVYFGGGTPSLAEPSTISSVLETVSRLCYLPSGAEVTLEANPTSTETATLRHFHSAGINRLSLGIQAFNSRDLLLLGRDNTVEDSLQALETAKSIFPGKVSIDLIFGRPHQTLDAWHKELDQALSVCDDHISLYQLTLERGTPFYRDVKAGKMSLPDSNMKAELYQLAVETLSRNGFRRYEVANFARLLLRIQQIATRAQNMQQQHIEKLRLGREINSVLLCLNYLMSLPCQRSTPLTNKVHIAGAESRHNLSYWKGTQYIGVGPGAHGRFIPFGSGSETREARVQTLEPNSWMKEVETRGHATRKQVPQTKFEILEEVLMLGLRTADGLPNEKWQTFSPFGKSLSLYCAFKDSKDVQDLVKSDLLVLNERGIKATSKGLSVVDSIIPMLLLHLEKSASY